MAGERNRITELVEYIESQGININLGKNKARGNKGFFKAANNIYRIDISDNLSEEEILKVLVHEFIHYIHFTNDKTLKSPKFLFGDKFDDYEEDLIKLTVDSISKCNVAPLFNTKNVLKSEISKITDTIKLCYPDFKIGTSNNAVEKNIKKHSCKYLLKYDNVKVFKGFKYKIYSVQNLEQDFPCLTKAEKEYIKLLSKRRALKRINSKISRLNRYYNSTSELIARSFEYYVLLPLIMKEKTPELYQYYQQMENNISHLPELLSIIRKN